MTVADPVQELGELSVRTEHRKGTKATETQGPSGLRASGLRVGKICTAMRLRDDSSSMEDQLMTGALNIRLNRGCMRWYISQAEKLLILCPWICTCV